MIVTQDMIDMSDDEEEEMDWEEEEEYYNSIEFEELHQEAFFSENSNDKELDTDLDSGTMSSDEIVDTLMRAFDLQEDRRTRGSS
jgi:hypothetical protein